MIVGTVQTPHVKFVSYTGRYPNLCSGILTLEIDGEEYKFGGYGFDDESIFKRFWYSGGGLLSDYSGVTNGEWRIDIGDLPERFQKYAYEIDAVFNENVEHGCCGGCI